MIPGSANPLLLAAAEGGYQIERSLRFNSADSAYLSRTPASSGNRKTWTWAGWVKICNSTVYKHIFVAGTGVICRFGESGGSHLIHFSSFNGSTFDWILETSAVYRDVSAWMHLMFVVDTTQATSTNRIKSYVNGEQVTSFSTATYPNQNTDWSVNNTVAHYIGGYGASLFGNFYLADIHFIDGQALTPTSFGEFDATTSVWNPKAYTGSYGTNGFLLDFSDNSAATATTLGKDRAGSNNWTPNNLSVTAGSGNDSLVDVPTNGAQTDTGAGGEVRGNYCTWNPLSSTATLRNGNLDASATTYAYGTIQPSTGKWYFEGVVITVADIWIGVSAQPVDYTTVAAYRSNGQYYDGSTWSAYGSTYTTNDVISVAVDMDGGSITFYKNGVSQGAKTRSVAGRVFIFSGDTTGALTANFGQRPFAYTAPSGFKALNTANLPAPVVTKPSTVMDVALYTGNNTARSITGIGFSPDFVWIKGRSGATDHALYDIVRGVEKDLVSNSTAAETTQTTGLTAFNSDGFSIGTLAKLNTNAATYAAWTWDAGSSTVTNTQGSISSQVRANASAGFSVVTYTGTGGNATVGHGLGVAPGMVIVKRRDTAANWQVRHTSIAAASSIQLNLTNAAASATTVWNSTAPSSTVFSVGTDATVNASGGTFVAYCFAPVDGYSSFGSYTGNGSADGPFVYLGFRPAFVLVKMSSSTGNWTILDDKREGYNVDNDPLFPNLANAEGTTDLIDITSNGFKVRTTDATFNTNTGTYVYAAFAEHPFQYARAR